MSLSQNSVLFKSKMFQLYSTHISLELLLFLEDHKRLGMENLYKNFQEALGLSGSTLTDEKNTHKTSLKEIISTELFLSVLGNNSNKIHLNISNISTGSSFMEKVAKELKNISKTFNIELETTH